MALYLQNSVQDLESLEDWDEIRGEKFALANEDFADLDTRLTASYYALRMVSEII